MLVVSAGVMSSCAMQLVALISVGMQISAAANIISLALFMILVDLFNVSVFSILLQVRHMPGECLRAALMPVLREAGADGTDG